MAVEISDDEAADPQAAIRTARLIGFIGLVPFICLSLWLYGIAPTHEWREGTVLLLLVYGAVILSFIGGARWGLAMAHDDTDGGDYALCIVPPLLGWLTVVTPVPYAFALLAVAFAAHGAWDSIAVHQERAPHWYGRLRTVLTLVVVATMLVAFAATA